MTERQKSRAGQVALGVGVAATLALIAVYQDWWAVVVSIGGATIAVLERRGWSIAEAIAIATAVSVSFAVAGIGAFLIVMSPFSCARPDIPCPPFPPPILLAGLAALVLSGIGVVLVAWHLRHRRRRDTT